MSLGVPWNADGADKALVAWLKTQGNFRRWGQDSKLKLAKEIQDFFKGADIHRTERAIACKVDGLVNRYHAACRLLAARGVRGEDVVRGQVDRGLLTEVRAKCLHFCELWPALGADGAVVERRGGEGEAAQAGGADASGEMKPASGRATSKRRSEALGRPSKRRCPTPTAVTVVHESSTSSGCVTYQAVSSSVALVQGSSYDRASTTMMSQEAYSLLDPELQRQVAVNRVACEKKMSDVYLDAAKMKQEHEIEGQKWRAERERVGLEAQRCEYEMELAAKKLLKRLEMEDAGVEAAVIDQVFPLPRP